MNKCVCVISMCLPCVYVVYSSPGITSIELFSFYQMLTPIYIELKEKSILLIL